MPIESEESHIRRKRVSWALGIVQDTPLAPCAYELGLLDKYVREQLSLDDVIILLEAREREIQVIKR
ncbi:MAG: hypothetical protein EOO63_01365 [Hymenobacter sp.]|nr:MAG: hypothetical protein EOO63_01365 [Hymenobacter sp.]